MVALMMREELKKFEKLKVCQYVMEELFRNDPMAIKIGIKWVITNKVAKTKLMSKAQFVGKELEDDIEKGELFAGTLRLPALRYSVSKLATHRRGEARHSVAVMNVKSAFLYGRPRHPNFIDVIAEDPKSQEEGVLPKWVGTLFATRNAPLHGRSPKPCEVGGSCAVPPCSAHCFEVLAHVEDLFVAGSLEMY